MFVARLATEHFEFVSLGETEKECMNSMRYGLLTHAEHVNIPKDWFEDYEDGILILELQPGQCVRDDSVISNTRSMG